MVPEMSWKRNLISMMVWAVYLLGSSAALLYYTYESCEGKNVQSAWVVAACLLLFIIGMASLLRFFVCRLALLKQRKKNCMTQDITENLHRGRMVFAILEGILVCALLAGGVMLRALHFPEWDNSCEYYLQAMVEEGKVLAYPTNGLQGIYQHLLHFLFFLFGNQWVIGIWLQIVLQMLGSLLLYAGVRIISGRIPAVIVLGAQMLVPASVLAGLQYSPDILFLFFFAAGLYTVSFSLDAHADGTQKVWGWVAVALMAPVLAFICWLDLSGLILVIVFLSMTFLRVNEPYGNVVRVIGKIILFLILFLVSFAGIIAFYAMISNQEILPSLENWLNQYRVFETTFFALPEQLTVSGSVLLAGMVYAGVLYLFSGQKEKNGLWFAAMLFCWILGGLKFEAEMTILPFLTECCAYLLVAIGFLQTFVFPDPAERKTETEESMESFDTADVAVEIEDMQIEDTQKEDTPKQVSNRIANPLPLPKKSVRKAADYGKDIPEDQLYYDLEVDENDDYDLKEP